MHLKRQNSSRISKLFLVHLEEDYMTTKGETELDVFSQWSKKSVNHSFLPREQAALEYVDSMNKRVL